MTDLPLLFLYPIMLHRQGGGLCFLPLGGISNERRLPIRGKRAFRDHEVIESHRVRLFGRPRRARLPATRQSRLVSLSGPLDGGPRRELPLTVNREARDTVLYPN